MKFGPYEDVMKVLDLELGKTKELQGDINTADDVIVSNIRHSIRLQFPQVRPQGIQPDRICLVGGGPSLTKTEHELQDLYLQGAKIVTVNGAYQWCVERNYKVAAQIVLDAQEANARFVQPAIPNCRYFIASQCHPTTWAAVADRPDVWIWHAVGAENTWRSVLDEYYVGKMWQSIIGGSTVAMRAIILLRTLGFLRMDLFGIDSCWMDGAHHSYAQPENDKDKRFPINAHPTGHPELARVFWCDPWHMKQLEDFMQMIRLNGQNFLLNVHGDGLLAYALQTAAQIEVSSAVSFDSERG